MRMIKKEEAIDWLKQKGFEVVNTRVCIKISDHKGNSIDIFHGEISDIEIEDKDLMHFHMHRNKKVEGTTISFTDYGEVGIAGPVLISIYNFLMREEKEMNKKIEGTEGK